MKMLVEKICFSFLTQYNLPYSTRRDKRERPIHKSNLNLLIAIIDIRIHILTLIYLYNYLHSDEGVEYIAPSKAVLPIIKSTTAATAASQGGAAVNPAIAHLHPDHVQVNTLNMTQC